MSFCDRSLCVCFFFFVWKHRIRYILDILSGSFFFLHHDPLYNVCTCESLSLRGETQGVAAPCWPCCNCRKNWDRSGSEGRRGLKLKTLCSGSVGALVSLPEKNNSGRTKKRKRERKREWERVRVSNLELINDSKSRYQFSLGIFFFGLQINGACQGQKDQPSSGSALSGTTSSFYFFLLPLVFFFTTYKRSCMWSVWEQQISCTFNNKLHLSSIFKVTLWCVMASSIPVTAKASLVTNDSQKTHYFILYHTQHSRRLMTQHF